MSDGRTKVAEQEILEAMATHPDPVLTSTELAAEFDDITQQAIYKRLESFRKRGLVVNKKVGANGTIWWLTQDGRERLAELRR